MNKYIVELMPRAYRDIEEIYAYIAYEKLSPENAKGQIDRIKKAIERSKKLIKKLRHGDRSVFKDPEDWERLP